MSFDLSRRAFLALAPFAVAACTTTRQAPLAPERYVDPAYVMMYGALQDGEYLLPAIDVTKVHPDLFRQQVIYNTSERPGTIVVEPENRFLYLVQEGGQAMRYGVGVGRAGYDYQGDAVVGRKGTWPTWTPTTTMIRENPEVNAPWASGMPGGPGNPLGARALYLYKNGRDTLYRLHGTNDPTSIGRSVSSGCVRLFNHDIIDLHRRVPTGSRVVVMNAMNV